MPSSRCLPFSLRDITVEPVMFLYMMAANIVFPTLQALTYHKVCLHRFNGSFCSLLQNATFQREHVEETDYVQSKTSYWILLSNITMIVPATVTVLLFLGSFSDKIGRKFPVLLPIMGATLQAIACLFNAVFPAAPLWLLLLGPFLSGLCGGIISCLMAIFSYITHVASAQSRTMRLGIAESMILLAGTMGVFVSGVMLDRTSFTFVFGFSAVLLFMALIYAICWLPDLKPREPSAPVLSWWRWVGESLGEMKEFVSKPRTRNVRLNVGLLILSIDLMLLCTVGELDIILLFLRREPLAWSQSLFGYFRGGENLLRGLMLIAVLPLLKRKLHTHDTSIAIGGLISKVAGLIVLGCATQTWMVFLAGALGMGQSMPSAGIRSLMSNQVKQDEQGRLFSVLAVTESMTAIIAALLFNTIYPQTLHIFPGFAFLMAACISFIALLVMLYLHCRHQEDLCITQPYDTMVEEGGMEVESCEEISRQDQEFFHITTLASEDQFATM